MKLKNDTHLEFKRASWIAKSQGLTNLCDPWNKCLFKLISPYTSIHETNRKILSLSKLAPELQAFWPIHKFTVDSAMQSCWAAAAFALRSHPNASAWPLYSSAPARLLLYIQYKPCTQPEGELRPDCGLLEPNFSFSHFASLRVCIIERRVATGCNQHAYAAKSADSTIHVARIIYQNRQTARRQARHALRFTDN